MEQAPGSPQPENVSPEETAKLRARLKNARDEFLYGYVPHGTTDAEIKRMCDESVREMMAAFNALPPSEQEAAMKEQREDVLRRREERKILTRRRY